MSPASKIFLNFSNSPLRCGENDDLVFHYLIVQESKGQRSFLLFSLYWGWHHKINILTHVLPYIFKSIYCIVSKSSGYCLYISVNHIGTSNCILVNTLHLICINNYPKLVIFLIFSHRGAFYMKFIIVFTSNDVNIVPSMLQFI